MSIGNEIDTYAVDVDELTAHLKLKGDIHIGHSTGGGEVNATLHDTAAMAGFRTAFAANRSQLRLDVSSGPFYSFNRPTAKLSKGLIRKLVTPGG